MTAADATGTRLRLIKEERSRLLRAIALAEEYEQWGMVAMYRGQLRALNLNG